MTSRNDEVTVDIEVEGGEKAERSFNRAEKGARKFERSARGLIGPLIGAGLLTGLLGGGLLGLALAGGSASNAVLRIQSSIENLVSTAFRSLEGGIDFAVRQFDKLPAGAQVAVLATAVIIGLVLAKLIGAAAGAVAGAISGLLAPLGPAIVSGITTLLAGISVALLAAITAIAVGIASLVFIAWDLIFNDGQYLARFDEWLAQFSFFQWGRNVDVFITAYFKAAIPRWFNAATEFFQNGWDAVTATFGSHFILPFANAWRTFTQFFTITLRSFFGGTVPNFFVKVWAGLVAGFIRYFIVPFRAAWDAVEDFMIGAINTLIGYFNILLRSIANLPIPKVTVGIAFVNKAGIRIPFPTFSVSTQRLGSLVGGFDAQIPTIPLVQSVSSISVAMSAMTGRSTAT